jgi:hypothetical protein
MFNTPRAAFALGLALGIGGLQIACAGTPRLEFEKTSHDFGRISLVQSVNAKFAFKNAGDATLKLTEVTTSCGCTEATAEPRTLEPGQTGEITFTVKMTSARSLIKNHIFVESNDPNNPKADLLVQVDYVPLFEILPILVRLDMRLGQVTNATAKIRRTDGKPLGLIKLEPSKPWIKATLDPETKSDATEARVLLEAKPEGASRYYSEVVRLFADQQNEPAVTAVLMGRISGDVKVTPESLVWNLADPKAIPADQKDAAMSRRLSISSSVAKPLTLRNATSSLPELKVDLLPGEKNDGYQLVASLAGVPKGNLRGTISFDTNLPGQPTVQVPVIISVRAEEE